MSGSGRTFEVRQAVEEDLEHLAAMFDNYRMFYGKPSAPDSAKAFLRERLLNQDSVLLIARSDDGLPAGFTQLYPQLSSVRMRPYLILNDLFVSKPFRREGVGRLLMQAAIRFAESAGAPRIELETEVANDAAQALYESLGFRRMDDVHRYALEIGEED